jgi:hypothetical protein
MHARFLAYGGDLSGTDLVRPGHIILQINLIAQIHLGCAYLGDAMKQVQSFKRERRTHNLTDIRLLSLEEHLPIGLPPCNI